MRRTRRHRHQWTPTVILTRPADDPGHATEAVIYRCATCGAEDWEQGDGLTAEDIAGARRAITHDREWWVEDLTGKKGA